MRCYAAVGAPALCHRVAVCHLEVQFLTHGIGRVCLVSRCELPPLRSLKPGAMLGYGAGLARCEHCEPSALVAIGAEGKIRAPPLTRACNVPLKLWQGWASKGAIVLVVVCVVACKRAVEIRWSDLEI